MLEKLYNGFSFENGGKIYRGIGVHQFKKIVPVGDFWILLFNKLFSKRFRLISSQQDAEVWIVFTVVVELLHLVTFILMFYFIIDAVEEKGIGELIKLTIINFLVNLYPILIQRYNRLRILKIYKVGLQDLKNNKVVY